MADFQNSTPPSEAARKKPGIARGRLMLVAPLVLVAAVLAITLVDRERTPERNVDDDLCPLDATQITASATLLVDLSKPLYDTPSLFGLLHRVSGDLRMDEEIEVYAIAAQSDSAAVEAGAEAGEAAAAAPMLMGRLCKPYNDADLLVGQAKDQRGVRRDCDDLPAQLPINLRDVAGRFCTARNDLQVRINALAAQTEGRARVPGAELVEMLEGIRETLLQRPAPRTLYVFSDMLQHAAWYSHFDLDWTQWSSADYLEALAGSSLRQESGLDVSIFYLPRQWVTESLRPRNAHQQFWRSFFQGANVHFEDLPALPVYAVQPLMRRDGALAARDREEFDRLVAETELLQAKIAEARSQLDELQRRPATANADTESAATEAQLRELESVLQAAQQEARPLDEGGAGERRCHAGVYPVAAIDGCERSANSDVGRWVGGCRRRGPSGRRRAARDAAIGRFGTAGRVAKRDGSANGAAPHGNGARSGAGRRRASVRRQPQTAISRAVVPRRSARELWRRRCRGGLSA